MASRARKKRRTAVADALHSAVIHLLRGVRKEDGQTGVGPARLSALSVLVFAGPTRLTDLARIEQVKPPTMSRVIVGLESSGLVARKNDAADRRAVRLEATPRGIRLLQEGRRRRTERLAVAFEDCADEELDVLSHAAAIMERVSSAI